MSKGLEALSVLRDCFLEDGGYPLIKIIEKELKDYQEIKEIAKHYNWNDFTSEIFNVETDKKYQNLFNSAIVNIQKDYRKARTLEIIIKKHISPDDFISCYYIMNNKNWIEYKEYKKAYLDYYEDDEYMLKQEEFDLLKEVLL